MDAKDIALIKALGGGGSGGSGGSITVDSELSDTSTNPVQNRVVKSALDALSEEIDNCIQAPASAEVGQTIVVKAVDENGKPTEWKTENIPSGQANKTVSIIDITDKVIDYSFDFISAGQGIYFSSASIKFTFLAWNSDETDYKRTTHIVSGLFLVSYQSDNGWVVNNLSRGGMYLQFRDNPIEAGCYDMCLENTVETVMMQ